MKLFIVKEYETSTPDGVPVFDLSSKELQHCTGCWSCWWGPTPGRCVHKDLDEFYRGYLEADTVRFYCKVSQGFITSNMKALIDRIILIVLPYVSYPNGESLHDPRYSKYPSVEVIYQGEFLPNEEDAFVAYWERTMEMLFAPSFAATRDVGSVDIVEEKLDSAISRRMTRVQNDEVGEKGARTLIINGSPNGRKGNTEVICQQFINGMETPTEMRYVAEDDVAILATYMESFDCILFFFPLYVNAMPGIVKRLFEHMRPDENKSVGYFIQSGFEEAFQSDWLLAILRNFNIRMGYIDLGIVVAGGMGGVRFMSEKMSNSKAVAKLFARLKRAGELYEQVGVFDHESIQQFGQPYRFSEKEVKQGRVLRKFGVTKIPWVLMLRKNKAYRKRLDKPFGV